MSQKLLKELENCNIERAACKLIRGFQGKIVSDNICDALNLFSNIPCPETAVNFVYELPEVAEVMFEASDELSKMIPREAYGPKLIEDEEWISGFRKNLNRISLIHDCIRSIATQGKLRIGFHSMRDQQILFDRMNKIGITRFPFTNRRQFLRNVITQKLSAFKIVNDLVCIHGVYDGREVFWNGLGAEEHPQWHLKSEIQYDLGNHTSEYIKLLKDFESI